jgi:BirA family biotin operon repressor/biotin-[acetyl-CoA-carboxylase] ligase
MYHQHFNSIASTQTYLKDNLELLKEKDDDILISASEQSAGLGQRGNQWDNYANNITLSFTLEPQRVATLTPLEIGILVISFIKKKFNQDLFLKWPNDIITSEGKKCGGILCQYIDSSTVIVGVGINLGKFFVPLNNQYRHGLASVDQNLEISSQDQERISKELYLFVKMNRISAALDIKKSFDLFCYHLNMNVSIFEDGEDHHGLFKGIGVNGEALIEINSTTRAFLSSSLTIKN